MNSKTISIFIVAALLGYLVLLQLNLNIKVDDITDPKKTNTISLEVAELIKGNQKLREDLKLLQEQNEELSKSTEESEISLEKELNNYIIINGTSNIEGNGVEIRFDQDLEKTQMIDLINALRNIGAEAIEINDIRIVKNTSIDNKMLKNPITVKVIGNPDILHDSLLRRGGIMQQIGGFGVVDKKDKIKIIATKTEDR